MTRRSALARDGYYKDESGFAYDEALDGYTLNTEIGDLSETVPSGLYRGLQGGMGLQFRTAPWELEAGEGKLEVSGKAIAANWQ